MHDTPPKFSKLIASTMVKLVLAIVFMSALGFLVSYC